MRLSGWTRRETPREAAGHGIGLGHEPRGSKRCVGSAVAARRHGAEVSAGQPAGVAWRVSGPLTPRCVTPRSTFGQEVQRPCDPIDMPAWPWSCGTGTRLAEKDTGSPRGGILGRCAIATFGQLRYLIRPDVTDRARRYADTSRRTCRHDCTPPQTALTDRAAAPGRAANSPVRTRSYDLRHADCRAFPPASPPLRRHMEPDPVGHGLASSPFAVRRTRLRVRRLGCFERFCRLIMC